MQEKESAMVARCELKIPSLGITVRQHLASLVMPNGYTRGGIFNLHLTTIKESYIVTHFRQVNVCSVFSDDHSSNIFEIVPLR